MGILAFMYLSIGFSVYMQDVHMREAMHICSPYQIGKESSDSVKMPQDCPQQVVIIINELPTAFFLTAGWLPLLLARTMAG